MPGVFCVGGTEDGWDQVAKLQGNAARAKMELERRDRFWAGVVAVVAAAFGGFLGGQLIVTVVG